MKGKGLRVFKGLRGSKIIDLREAMKPSPLEEDYVRAYGQEFVDDLKRAFYWAQREVRKQELRENLSFEDIVSNQFYLLL
jgi:hypothetical protein